jgi:hypothetical protein
MFKLKTLFLLSFVGYLMFGNSTFLHASEIRKKYGKDGRLLWEYNSRDLGFKLYEYKPIGDKFYLDAVRICRDLNGDGRLEKQKDVCFSLMKFQMGPEVFTPRGPRPLLLYIVNDPAIIEVKKKDELEIIQSQDPDTQKERIIEHLKFIKNHHSFKNELEESLQKIDGLPKSENPKLTDADFQSIRKVLRTALLDTTKKIELLKKEYSHVEFSIQSKDDFFLLGRKGQGVILKNTWSGITHVDEVRFDPWTGKQRSITMYRRGTPETYFEIDDSGGKIAYASYICDKLGNLMSVEILGADGNVNQKFDLNTLNQPFNFMVKGTSGNWIPWPKQLKWPIMEEKLMAILSQETDSIRPYR